MSIVIENKKIILKKKKEKKWDHPGMCVTEKSEFQDGALAHSSS